MSAPAGVGKSTFVRAVKRQQLPARQVQPSLNLSDCSVDILQLKDEPEDDEENSKVLKTEYQLVLPITTRFGKDSLLLNLVDTSCN
jgi:hypothetical protein